MATTSFTRSLSSAVVAAAFIALCPAFANGQAGHPAGDKLDAVLRSRAHQLVGRSRVIIEFAGTPDVRVITAERGVAGRQLRQQRAQVAELDNRTLASL